MKVSVIIPCYNVEKWVAEAINSVLNQPFKDIEIIAVDDGSTDNTLSICKKIEAADHRVKVVHKENGGHTSARNAGLSVSQGDYFIFLDSDDRWMDNVLGEEFLTILNKEYDVVQYSTCLTNQWMNRCQFTSIRDGVFEGSPDLAWESHKSHLGGAFYKSSKYKANTIFEQQWYNSLKYGEDRILNYFFFSMAEKICFVNKTLYMYRQNPSSLMHSRSKIRPENYYLEIIQGWNCAAEYMKIIGVDGYKGCLAMTGGLTFEMIQSCSMNSILIDVKSIAMKSVGYKTFSEFSADSFNGKNRKAFLLYNRFPIMFRIQYRFRGVLHSIFEYLLKFQLISACYERVKYPDIYYPIS